MLHSPEQEEAQPPLNPLALFRKAERASTSTILLLLSQSYLRRYTLTWQTEISPPGKAAKVMLRSVPLKFKFDDGSVSTAIRVLGSLDQARQLALRQQHELHEAKRRQELEIARIERDMDRPRIAFEQNHTEYLKILQHLMVNDSEDTRNPDWIQQQLIVEKRNFENEVRVRNAKRGWTVRNNGKRRILQHLSAIVHDQCDTPDGQHKFGILAEIACAPDDPDVAQIVNFALQGIYRSVTLVTEHFRRS